MKSTGCKLIHSQVKGWYYVLLFTFFHLISSFMSTFMRRSVKLHREARIVKVVIGSLWPRWAGEILAPSEKFHKRISLVHNMLCRSVPRCGQHVVEIIDSPGLRSTTTILRWLTRERVKQEERSHCGRKLSDLLNHPPWWSQLPDEKCSKDFLIICYQIMMKPLGIVESICPLKYDEQVINLLSHLNNDF